MKKCSNCSTELDDKYKVNGMCGPCNYKYTNSTMGLWGPGTQLGPQRTTSISYPLRDMFMKKEVK